MRTLFWLLALFSLAVGLSLAARYNEGYVLLVLPPWRVQVSLNLLMLVLVLVFILVYALLRLVMNTLRMPAAVQEFRLRKQKEKAVQAVLDALRFLYEGRYGHAVAHAERAHAAGESPGLTALLAARAARAMRDEKRELGWLERAAEHDREIRTARLMTAADLHYDARRFDAGLESLDLLQRSGQRHIAALRLALRTHQALGHWRDVLRLTRQLEKHKALTAEHAASLKLRAHQENIRILANEPVALLGYWRDQPSAERADARLALAAAQALIAGGDSAAAQRIVEQQLDAEWNSELALLYADCRGGDLLARLTRAENWLKKQPGDALLLLALGRLCQQQQLWGKAQSYLEASLSVQSGRAAHIELARLFDHLGRADQANHHYRAAAAMV